MPDTENITHKHGSSVHTHSEFVKTSWSDEIFIHSLSYTWQQEIRFQKVTFYKRPRDIWVGIQVWMTAGLCSIPRKQLWRKMGRLAEFTAFILYLMIVMILTQWHKKQRKLAPLCYLEHVVLYLYTRICDNHLQILVISNTVWQKSQYLLS